MKLCFHHRSVTQLNSEAKLDTVLNHRPHLHRQQYVTTTVDIQLKSHFRRKKSHQFNLYISIKMHIWTQEFIENKLSTLEISRLEILCKTQHKVMMIFNFIANNSKYPSCFFKRAQQRFRQYFWFCLLSEALRTEFASSVLCTTNLISTSLSSYLLIGEIRVD